MSTNTFLNVCPHCGFESEDDAICRACGRLYDEDLPLRNVSAGDVLMECVSGLARDCAAHLHKPRKIYEDDPMIDPGWSLLSGNIFNHDEEEQTPPVILF